MAPKAVRIEHLRNHVGEVVRVQGWVRHRRRKGKLVFLVVRDGSGIVQAVVFKGDVSEAEFEAAKRADPEAALILEGEVRDDPRAPGGVELGVRRLELVSEAPEYPIGAKEHGVDFLLRHRHLWIRSPRQGAILRIRDEVMGAAEDFLRSQGFVRFDAPILTGSAPEGTTNLFEIEYFDLGKAYLSQSGQLYAEAGALALGRVYTLGPTFRAERSKTRRHLTEFWMLEPEAAFVDFEENLRIQEEMVAAIVRRVLARRRRELEVLERDAAKLEPACAPPYPRIRYDEALKILEEAGEPLPWGEDFGAPHERILSERFEKPVFVTHYPVKVKAFYMEPDPENPDLALCADLLAPEGYGEIIGGSQRIHDLELLEQRLREWGLNPEDYEWYLDLRRYGSVPHSGFGLGIERTVAWICGLEHIREAIPFPRMLYRMYP